MTFARYFKTSSYFLIGSGFLAVASTGAVDLFPAIWFSCAFAGSLFIDTVALKRRIPAWSINCLVAASLAFFALDTSLVSRSFLISSIHLIFLLAAIKLMTLSNDRDYLLLYLMSFAELLAASVLTVNIIWGLGFLAFLFSGILTLVLFEMRRSNAEALRIARVRPLVTPINLQGTGLELFSPFPARLLTRTAIGIVMFVLALAVPLFFLLPRVNLGGFKPPSGTTRFLSGFSDHVELGQIGSVKLSNALVMRVRIAQAPGELPADLKWRGISFDRYDGRSWRRSDPRRRPVQTQGRYYKLADTAQGTKWIYQTFFIEALSADVVFAAHRALAVSKDAGMLERDGAESLYTKRDPHKKLRYDAISDPIRPDPANMSDWSPIPREILDTYLQLPSQNVRIYDLARRAAGQASTKYARAVSLEQYLRSHYTYSLELCGTPNSEDPLSMFLFELRRGHCEYFASAMTIMLRHLGIPARLVNGFRAGEYNSIGRDFIVRQYDAHSWVEAYIPPYGWIEFDPTPADPQRHQAALIRLLSNLADAVDLWWWEDVVNYDSSKQYRIISVLRSWSAGLGNWMTGILETAYEKSRTAIAGLSSPASASAVFRKWVVWAPWIPVMAALLVRPWRRRMFGLIRRRFFRKNTRVIAGTFYAEALQLLSAHGMKRTRGETPMEFVRKLGSHPVAIPLLALTRMYNSIRFGPPDMPFQYEEAQAQLQMLRRSLRG